MGRRGPCATPASSSMARQECAARLDWHATPDRPRIAATAYQALLSAYRPRGAITHWPPPRGKVCGAPGSSPPRNARQRSRSSRGAAPRRCASVGLSAQRDSAIPLLLLRPQSLRRCGAVAAPSTRSTSPRCQASRRTPRGRPSAPRSWRTTSPRPASTAPSPSLEAASRAGRAALPFMSSQFISRNSHDVRAGSYRSKAASRSISRIRRACAFLARPSCSSLASLVPGSPSAFRCR